MRRRTPRKTRMPVCRWKPKKLGINAKGATKRLNEQELEKVKNYFETGKNVSEEIVEINKKNTLIKSNVKKIKRETKTSYFPNRLIAKS